MAITPFSFNPPAGFADTSAVETRPANEGRTREIFQMFHSQTRDYINGVLVPALTENAGWLPLAAECAYASADAPSYTMTANTDVTANVYPGVKIKLTQGGAQKYYIVTASSVSAGATTVTLYAGKNEDNGLTADPAADVCYSYAHAPQGFPMDPNIWTVEVTSNQNTGVYTGPMLNTWYQGTNPSITVPAGLWRLEYECAYNISAAATQLLSGQIALSTSPSSVSDGKLETWAYDSNSQAIVQSIHKSSIVSLPAKTAYYLIVRTTQPGVGNMTARGDYCTTILRAVCAYFS